MMLNELRPTNASFMHLERHLNGGSPSGFSFVSTPGPGFRPLDSVDQFDLPVFDCAAFGGTTVGSVPTLKRGELPVHPDMAQQFEAATGRAPHRWLPAVPGSSGRTLSTEADGMPFYAKVSYQGLLGRVTRKMTKAHVLSAIEVSSLYQSSIDAALMPDSFHIYREHCGLYFPETAGLSDWGYVERDIAAYPSSYFIEVPAFSLFFVPSNGHPCLLAQLVDAIASLRTVEGFFTRIIQPLLDLYFSSLTVLGLQPEAHAQNVVFLLDDSYIPVGIALRDMESVDKDLPLLETLNLAHHFTPTGYKFLTKDRDDYQIKHSFMYDFKLGVYLLGPLVDAWAASTCSTFVPDLEDRIRSYARSQLVVLPDDFFPDGVWYDYDAVVHEGRPTREYRQHPNPRFR